MLNLGDKSNKSIIENRHSKDFVLRFSAVRFSNKTHKKGEI